jgi:hypothetical protein
MNVRKRFWPRDWQIDCQLTGWPINSSAVWVISKPTDWRNDLTKWPVKDPLAFGLTTDYLTDRMTDLLTLWLTEWPSDWPTEWRATSNFWNRNFEMNLIQTDSVKLNELDSSLSCRSFDNRSLRYNGPFRKKFGVIGVPVILSKHCSEISWKNSTAVKRGRILKKAAPDAKFPTLFPWKALFQLFSRTVRQV